MSAIQHRTVASTMLVPNGLITRVHHMNCATFRPAPRTHMVTHVLALEHQHGVVLVDSGLGKADVVQPTTRLGITVRPLRPALLESETAVSQLSALGIAAGDVSDVVATHLDYDHIGGASDFPNATIHTTASELEAATTRGSVRERIRYRPEHLASLGRVATYGSATSEVLGLRSHQLDADGAIHLVPMPGHTRGHAAVVVRDPRRGWLLHAGDSAMHRNAILNGRNTTPWPLRAAEGALAMERNRVALNHRTLWEVHSRGHRVFCSHDRLQYQALSDE